MQLLDRHTGAAVTETGETCWSMSPQGAWNYTGPLDIQGFPVGEIQVIAIGKAPKKIKKGQEPKHMPDGTVLMMRLMGEKWRGSCSADAGTIEAESAGLMGLGSKLCRKWLKEFGHHIIRGKCD